MTRGIKDWTDDLRLIIEEQARALVTCDQFSSNLRRLLGNPDCPYDAIRIAFINRPPFGELTIGPIARSGFEIKAAPTDSLTHHPSDDPRHTACRIELWRKPVFPPSAP